MKFVLVDTVDQVLVAALLSNEEVQANGAAQSSTRPS
jgi:hypothetical protein